ncbi:hypothetical protein OH460_09090 [Vibrio sp. Makdt]|uniref:hypothetical protein n=1 Tax=Vibrio sp. Makdt TaxID=2998828 RepID=UPI0022CDB4A0|nr:hypothetical protein [Vibrio sp. Makdt]MDA0152457.1 hypothetical protein [Vibrio sp. Makdt]
MGKTQLVSFFSVNGVVWNLFQSQTLGGVSRFTSNHPARVIVEGDLVHVIDSNDDGDNTISETVKLHSSLLSLALAMASSNTARVSQGEPVTLEQAVLEAHQQVADFEIMWKTNNQFQPEEYPMQLPSANSGAWFEQIFQHEVGDR